MLRLLIRFCVKEPWLVVLLAIGCQCWWLVCLQSCSHRRDPQRR